MTGSNDIREGGCACGAVRFKTKGAPLRGGLCHCMTCRKAHASAFNAFLVFAKGQVKITGETKVWHSTPDYPRCFCPNCGSSVAWGDDSEIELSLGSFDEPGLFEPEYELWVIRREPWLVPLDVPQFDGNRTPD